MVRECVISCVAPGGSLVIGFFRRHRTECTSRRSSGLLTPHFSLLGKAPSCWRTVTTPALDGSLAVISLGNRAKNSLRNFSCKASALDRGLVSFRRHKSRKAVYVAAARRLVFLTSKSCQFNGTHSVTSGGQVPLGPNSGAGGRWSPVSWLRINTAITINLSASAVNNMLVTWACHWPRPRRRDFSRAASLPAIVRSSTVLKSNSMPHKSLGTSSRDLAKSDENSDAGQRSGRPHRPRSGNPLHKTLWGLRNTIRVVTCVFVAA